MIHHILSQREEKSKESGFPMHNLKGMNKLSIKKCRIKTRSISAKSRQDQNKTIEPCSHLNTKLLKSACSRSVASVLSDDQNGSQEFSDYSGGHIVTPKIQVIQIQHQRESTEAVRKVIDNIKSLEAQLIQLEVREKAEKNYQSKLMEFAVVAFAKNAVEMIEIYKKISILVRMHINFIKKQIETVGCQMRGLKQRLKYTRIRTKDTFTENEIRFRGDIETLQRQFVPLRAERMLCEAEAREWMDAMFDSAQKNDKNMFKLYSKCQSMVYKKLNIIERKISEVHNQIHANQIRLTYLLKKEVE